MPKEKTPRLKLNNPSTGEFDWDKSWWDNTKIIDNHPGIKVVTTSTLPDEPWIGQHVFNVDIHSLLVWNGQNWVNQSTGVFDYLPAGDNDILARRVVYINSQGKLEHADSKLKEIYAYRILGLALSDISANQYGLVKKCGQIKNPAWSLQPGQEYYLGNYGDIAEKLPKKAKLRLCVGVAIGVDAISVRIMKM